MPWHISFIKGIIIGFAIAAPVGPVGALCIKRTMHNGRMAGLMSGLGAAAADTCFAIIAAFGLTFISDILMKGSYWLRLVGGLFLLYLGIKTFVSQYSEDSHLNAPTSHFSYFLTTFLLTITNPLTILGFAALFASSGLSYTPHDFISPAILSTGVFLGSGFWWVIVTEGITFFRKKITKQVFRWTNKIAACIIIGFGVYMLLSLHMPRI